jgi:HEAT repeat protein/beta-lactamase regulating signal transducer with metallopeptidase domain
MSETTLRAAAWLLTYALHSTLLLGAAALLARRLRGEAWRETLWKAALVGGLVTATVQTQSGYNPPGGTWRLGSTVDLAVQTDAETPAQPWPTLEQPADAMPRSASTESIASTVASQVAGERAPTVAPAPASTDPTESTASFSIRPLVNLAVGLWAMIAALLIVRIAWRQGRLRSMLRGRRAVSDPEVLAMLAGLRRNAGLWRPVRLTTCDATPTPLALGGGEVCVPPRFLVDLDPEQQRSALAHELAHLARRDPAWHFAIGIIEALFFFQPLNRVARLRLRESAEFLCDEWAARQTGSPLGLARCLAEVASWVAPGRAPIPAGTMAMAEGGSPLVQRVQRLTTWRGGSQEGNGPMRIAGATLLVLAVAVAAPAVASSGERRTQAVAPEQAAAVDDDTLRVQTVVQDVVIRHPDPSEPLARRWEWAVAEVARRRLNRAWIAYSVPTNLGTEGWITDSGETPLSDLRREPLNRRFGASAEDAVVLFSVARNGEVDRVSARNSAGFDTGRTPVVWLGRADGDQSFAQLRRLADSRRNLDVLETLVEVIGVHRGDAVVPYLAAVLGRDGSDGVRQGAAQALGRHPGDEALVALETAVERDGSKDVRREAVEAIGRMRHPRSGALLREIAASAGSSDTRRHAAEALGEAGGPEAFASLRRIALAEANGDVARQAAESLGNFPAEQAAPALEQVAWTARRDEAARQAAESLARLPAPWTVVALDSIARTHPNSQVAHQAVESLGRYRGVVSNGYLQAIARNHPDRGVREEALDQLRRAEAARRGGGTESDPDSGLPIDPDP